MYRAFFGISDDPFSITPDPRFLFLSHQHREALAHLLYGAGAGGGFVLLTGEVGTGKTTLCRALLEQAPEGVEIALVLNPRQSAPELVATVCDELGVAYPEGADSLKVLVDRLNRHLLEVHAAGRRSVLVIDEAQDLGPDVLEQVRLLTNLETPTRKLLQVILIGQPELGRLLSRPGLRQVAQRVTARYHLEPFRRPETAAYIRHRLQRVGADPGLFTPGAVALVHRHAGGIPRLINVLCDRALLGAYASNRAKVDRGLVRRAAAEIAGRGRPPRWRPAAAVAVLALAAVGAAAWQATRSDPSPWRGLLARGPTASVAPAPAPEPGAAAAPAAGESLAARLAGRPVPADGDAAFRVLFGLWGRDYDRLAGLTACERAAAAGLRCLARGDGWEGLTALDRPAVLSLGDGGGRRHRVAAVTADGQGVTVVVDETRLRVGREELEGLWDGEFVVLWQPPPSGGELIRVWQSGPDVEWLRARLAEAGVIPAGGGPPAGEPLFDRALAERVREFQRAQGLEPDGLVGPRTVIRLRTAAGQAGVPTLRAPQEPERG